MTTTQIAHTEPKETQDIPPLETGDCLDQPTFHERYERMPEHVRAELIGGIVYMASPVKRPHGRGHQLLGGWLAVYDASTPGVDSLADATHILGKNSEPQPDLSLVIKGGQTREGEDEYVYGAPELAIEVASSSESYDLHQKKADYLRYGVQEYLVYVLRQQRVVWFVREGDAFAEMPAGADGVLRSRLFKGLWLDVAALLRGDTGRMLDVLREGLASTEHAALVQELARKA